MRGAIGCSEPRNANGATAREALAGASVMRSRLVVAHGLPSDAPMAHQYIFTMHRLTKAYPPDKTVLKDVTLAFLPGAKIGVLGYNGAGKSTLLQDHGRASTPSSAATRMLAPGATVGLLEQEPQLDEAKDVRGNVEDGVAETTRAARPLQRARRELLRRDRRRVRRACRRRSTPPTRGTSTRNVEYAMDALRLPPADADVTKLSRRRAPPRRALPAAARARPTCCCSTSRRTTSTPSRSRGWSGTSPSTRARSSRSPTIATSSTTSRAGSSSSTAAAGIPYEGNYSSWLEQKQKRLAQEERTDKARQTHDRRRARVGAPEPQGPPDEAEGAPAATTRRCSPQERNVKLDQVQIHIPAGPRLGDVVVEAEGLRKGFGDKLLIEDLSVHRCRAAASSA